MDNVISIEQKHRIEFGKNYPVPRSCLFKLYDMETKTYSPPIKGTWHTWCYDGSCCVVEDELGNVSIAHSFQIVFLESVEKKNETV